MDLPTGPKLEVDDYCFACGKANPKGLKLDFRFEGDEYACDFTLAQEYQGWTNIAHGGIVATILDEVMVRNLWEQGIHAVTAEFTVRLKQPVPVMQPCQARSRVVSSRKRIFEVEGEVTLPDGSIAAQSRGKFLKIENPDG